MRKRRIRKTQALLCAVLCITSLVATAQVTTTFTAGPGWSDAPIAIGSGSESGTNYSSSTSIRASRWVSTNRRYRSLIRISLDTLIPPGTVVQSAKLGLIKVGTTGVEDGNQGSNAFYLRQVTQSWNESTVTWSNAPSTTTIGQIIVPASTTASPVEIDVTTMLQAMVDNPTTNYGWMIVLLDESGGSKSRSFGSRKQTDVAYRPYLTVTTTQPISQIQAQRDYIFGGLDQAPISSGILTDYGLDFADPTIYDGVIRANNEVTIDSWRALYSEFLSSVINPSSGLKSLKVINDTLNNKWRANIQNDDRIIDVPVQFVRYQSLVSNASPSMITISNNKLSDVPGRTQSPYTTKYAFAAAPTMTYDLDGRVSFRFPTSVFINSSDKAMTNFSVDFDDGQGYRTVALDNVISVEYTSSGTKTLRFKITVTGNITYYSHSKFQVYSAASAQARYVDPGDRAFKFPRATDSHCPEPAFPNPEQYQGIGAGATVTVDYGDIGSRPGIVCSPQFIRPLILIEGFDVSKFSAFGTDNWDFEQVVENSRNGGLRAATSEGNDLNGKLSEEGYDLVFIDFNDGTGDIIRNAYLVENVIQWVNAHKINNPNTGLREQTVVLGQSMGGLVGRYAVCDMEKRRIANSSYAAHEVRLLVTQDSPHRGANVPLGFQSLINKLSTKKLTTIGLLSYGTTGAIVGSQLEIQDIVPALQQGKQLLNEPASKQMLILQDGQTNTFLDGDYRSMVTFNSGYTPTFVSRAIANGSECGESQIVNASDELFYANASLFVNPLLFTAAADILSASATIPPVNRGLGSLTDVPFHFLIPFTGKIWKTTIRINSTSLSGSGEIYSGKLTMEKKVLAIIPININVFDESTSGSGAYHWDSRPGGYYNLQSKQAKISGVNIDAYPIVEAKLTMRVAKVFNFVPTVSALDISTTPLTTSAVTSTYTNGANATYPSRFSNFKTQERITGDEPLGSYYNSKHLQFSLTSTTWLLNVIRGNNPVVSCSYSCGGGSGATMTGPTQLCSAPVLYSLSNIPPGATISWYTNGPVSVPPNSNGTTVTATPTTGVAGTATVNATFVTQTCGTTVKTTSVTVGNPPWPQESMNNDGSPSYINIGPNPTVAVGQEATIFWNDYPPKTQPITVTSQGNVVSSGPGWIVVTYPMPGTYTIAAETIGPCGWLQVNQLVTAYTGSGFRVAGSNYSYYPNPANDNITISSDSLKESAVKRATVPSDDPVTVKLIDSTGNTVRSRVSKGKTLTLNTSDLPNGLYYLNISNGSKTFNQQVVIKH